MGTKVRRFSSSGTQGICVLFVHNNVVYFKGYLSSVIYTQQPHLRHHLSHARSLPRGCSHDTPSILWAGCAAAICIMAHPKVVPHLMGHCSSNTNCTVRVILEGEEINGERTIVTFKNYFYKLSLVTSSLLSMIHMLNIFNIRVIPILEMLGDAKLQWEEEGNNLLLKSASRCL